MTLNEMIKLYATLSAAHTYILGFVYNHSLYYVTLTFAELVKTMKLGFASSKRGGAAKVRILTNKEQRNEFVTSGKAVYLGSENLLLANDKYNKGEHFERIITELLTDTVWEKDSVPFWKAGDIEINGEQVQIKMDSAELTNEKTLTKILALG